MPHFPYDEVRDCTRVNHVEVVDRAAEAVFEHHNFSPVTLREDYLRDQHGITITASGGLLAAGMFWRLSRGDKKL